MTAASQRSATMQSSARSYFCTHCVSLQEQSGDHDYVLQVLARLAMEPHSLDLQASSSNLQNSSMHLNTMAISALHLAVSTSCTSGGVFACRLVAFSLWCACYETTLTRSLQSYQLWCCGTWLSRMQLTEQLSKTQAAYSPCCAFYPWGKTS